MNKTEVRALIKRSKESLTDDDKKHSAQAVFAELEDLPLFQKSQSILCYWSLPDELSTLLFIEKWKDHKEIYLPVVRGADVELVLYRGAAFMQKGKFGILEPTGEFLREPNKIELGIIPGIAFTKQGYRLGRGGGYYDRLLPNLPGMYKLGVGYGFQCLENIPLEPHDIRLDQVICK